MTKSSITQRLLLSVWLLCVEWPIFSSAVCNSCSAQTNLACVSTTQFRVCVNGAPTGTATSCPAGYVCSTASASICEASGGVAVAGDCTDCNICDATNTFACTGVSTYALCLGTTTVSDLVGSCAPNYVCSIDFNNICGNATLGVVATCPSISDTLSTTTVNVTNPVQYCQSVQQNGRFPAGNELITTCKQYVYCFINNNGWSGVLYACPGVTYFNDTSRYCTSNTPTRCLGSTTTL